MLGMEGIRQTTVDDTYIIRNGEGDDLIGHRLNLREGSQVVHRQLQTEEDSSIEKLVWFVVKSSSDWFNISFHQQWS